MTSGFSSSDTDCLNRTTDHCLDVEDFNEIWDKQRLNDCIKWIDKHKFNKVCLQFSDDLIPFSTTIHEDLKRTNTSTQFCILGDTSYGSCCVDEIAASHLNANAIIHFGHACLSKVARLPVHYVFPNLKFDVTKFGHEFVKSFPNLDEDILVFYSTGLFYHLDDIKSALVSYTNVSFAELALDENPNNLCWKIPAKNLSDAICVWIGDDDQSLFNLTLTVNAKQWQHFDRQTYQLKIVSSPLATIWMRRRNFLVEKCKDAQAIGIVVGTLTTDGYLKVVDRIQSLARDRGIRTYLLSVGKINPAKLANFMEVDCFVFVGCPENAIYNSRDFYKPLLTVFEAELGLNPAYRDQYPNFYSVDFNEILPNGKYHKSVDGQIDESQDYDVSLISGRVRHMKNAMNGDTSISSDGQIERKSNQLMNTNSSGTFNDRTWTGLDPKLGNHEPVEITKGRSGIAMKYTENEH